MRVEKECEERNVIIRGEDSIEKTSGQKQSTEKAI